MPIPEGVISEIKYRNDIESVIAPYVNLKRRGKNLVGLCPFHNEKTPSFTVYPESGSFYCFGCGKGGDIFTFTSLVENLDYIEAVKLLAERSGVILPQDGYDNSMQRLKEAIYEINRETAKFYHSYLMSKDGKWALDYLTGRGLALKTIAHFGLGAAPDSSWDALLRHLKAKGFTEADMEAANVIVKGRNGGYYDRFRKRVMFPIINIRGRVIGFSGRAMPDDDKATAKYVNTSDTLVYKKSENLFAMNFAKNFCAERIILVEGNMDVISLHQSGFENTVAALGTSFTSEQAKLISRYTKEIVLTLDSDAAGQKAVKRAGDILKSTGLNVRVITVPDGKDPDEFIKKHGSARFSAILEGAVSEIEYKLLIASKGIDIETSDGKLKYLAIAAEIIAASPDIMERDIYISRLSEKCGVSKTALQARVEEIRKKYKKSAYNKEISSVIKPKYDSGDINPERRLYPAACAAEEAVIAVLMQHPDFYEAAVNSLKPSDMLTDLNKRIYTEIIKVISSGENLDISSFSQQLTPSELGYVVMLSNSKRADKNPLVVLKDSIRVILDEGVRKTASAANDISDEAWKENFQKLIKNKQKGNK